MSSLRDKEGYLLIDHRASPGLPADIARQSGFDPKFTSEGGILEASTMTCSHCTNSVVLNPERIRKREYCQKCDAYICDACHALTTVPNYQHASYVKISDLLLNDAEKRTALGSSLILLNNPNLNNKGDIL